MAKINNVRIQSKIDIQENWDKATNFAPLEGEIVFIQNNTTDKKVVKMKVGDGNTLVKDLSNLLEVDWNQTDENQAGYIKNKPTLGLLASHNEVSEDLLDENIKLLINNKVDISTLSDYYTKSEIDNFEFITVNDIDAICGTQIQVAEEGVMF